MREILRLRATSLHVQISGLVNHPQRPLKGIRKDLLNKKVLLRERKRHTARRVVSTPSVVLPGYPPTHPDLAGGGT